MRPVRLEVIAPTAQAVGICTACELVLSDAGIGQLPRQGDLDDYPQEWQDDCRRLADWVFDLANRHGESLLIKVIDPQSLEGLLKSLRYRVRRYPTFVVAGKGTVAGWEPEQLEALLVEALAEALDAGDN